MTTTPSNGGQPRRRRKHTKEFKIEAVRLARQPEIGFAKAARDLGVNESLLRDWAKKQVDEGADAFRGHGNRTTMEAELERLRRQVRVLEMERDILKKATAFFAKESR